MRWRASRVKPDVVRLAPTIRRPSQFIGYREPRADVNVERGPVQPNRGLARHVGVEVDYDEYRVATLYAGLRRTHSLRKAQNFPTVRKMETQVTELLQGRVRPSDRIEPGDEVRESRVGGLSRRPVPWLVLILLRVQILLAARPQRRVLA